MEIWDRRQSLLQNEAAASIELTAAD